MKPLIPLEKFTREENFTDTHINMQLCGLESDKLSSTDASDYTNTER